MQAIKNVAKQILPASLVLKMKEVRKVLTKYASSAPVVQIYINDGITDTKVGINNFFSYLSPTETTDTVANLVFYSQDGKELLKHQENLSHLGSLSLSVSDLFKKNNVTSPHGAVTLQLIPKSPRKKNYKKLGLVASQFFMFYHTKEGTIGHIHPLSVLDKKNTASSVFTSNQMIVSRELQKVVLYQVNPTFHSCHVEHSLVGMGNDETIAKVSNEFGPVSVKRIEFDLSATKDLPEYFSVKVSPLPSANSKPLLLRYYKNGNYSMSHS